MLLENHTLLVTNNSPMGSSDSNGHISALPLLHHCKTRINAFSIALTNRADEYSCEPVSFQVA